MPQIRLVLADTDQLFLEKFSAYLKSCKTTHFALELFTSPVTFTEWFENGGKTDLIVISSTLLAKLERPPAPGRSIIVLCDSAESMIPAGYASIHKYQPAQNLVGEILSACAESIPGSFSKRGSSGEVHLVLYADGSDLMNPLAPSLAYVKSRQGQPSFYLNLDQVSDTHTYFNGSNSRGLSEFLYYIKARKENLSLKAEACASQSTEFGVDFMKAHQNPQDMGRLIPSEVKSMIDALRDRAVYGSIVVSRALLFDEILTVLLNEAQRVYLTCLNHPSSHNRMKMIASHLTHTEGPWFNHVKGKLLCCIGLIQPEDEPIQLELPIEKAYLPFYPYNNHAYFPPAKEYQQALEAISSQERGYL